MHKQITGLVLLVIALGFLIVQPIPLCLVRANLILATVCAVPNPLSLFGLNPNILFAGVFAVVGIALILLGSAKQRRAAFVLDGGLLGFAGYVILALAVISLILGVVIGAALFSGIALGPPGMQLVLQPWQFALVLAVLGILFIAKGTMKGRHGSRA